jgi:citrate lyase beta subunit
VRINPPTSRDGLADLLALGATPPDIVLLPKCEDEGELRVARGALAPDVGLIAIVETARGLARCEALASAGVVALGFGALDLAVELRAVPEPGPMAYARGRVAAAAAVARIGCLDVPDLEFRDPEALRASAATAKRHGFTGKFAIHPAQVAPILAAFAPGTEEIERARRVVATFEAAGGAAAQLDGKMIDLPVVRAAREVLARAGAGR